MEHEMSVNEIKRAIVKMQNSKEYLQLINYYSTESLFKTLKVSRNELVHSNFLAWLLNPQSNHELGLLPLKKFLQTIAIISEELRNFDARLTEEFKDAFLLGDYILSEESQVRTEVVTGKITGYAREGRIDILLLLRFENSDKELPILIENKVLSSENKSVDEKQTQKYITWAEDEYADKTKYYDPIFVFLAPDYEKDIQCSSEEFFKMSYQNLVYYLIEPCLALSSKTQTTYMIENYLRCLSNSNLSEINSGKEDRIMAFSTNEKELLEKFYTSNKTLFDNVLAVLANDEEMSDEDRAKFKAAVKVANNRDYSKYLFEGNTYGKGRCVLAIVKKVVESNGITTFDELKDKFPDDLQGSIGVIEKVCDIKDNKKSRYYMKDEEIINLDTEIAVCSQWGIDNFPNILTLAKELGLNVTKQ